MDRRDDKAMATGHYPPKRTLWRRLWLPLIQTVLILTVASLAFLGVMVVMSWFTG